MMYGLPFLRRSPILNRNNIFLLVWGKQKIPISLGNQDFNVFSFLRSGATRNRTGDTRIFSPLLFFGFRKFADAHFWMQPTELWHFMNQLRYCFAFISFLWFNSRFNSWLFRKMVINMFIILL